MPAHKPLRVLEFVAMLVETMLAAIEVLFRNGAQGLVSPFLHASVEVIFVCFDPVVNVSLRSGSGRIKIAHETDTLYVVDGNVVPATRLVYSSLLL